METELTYTQEQKLKAAAKRFKFTDAELVDGAACVGWDNHSGDDWVTINANGEPWDYIPYDKLKKTIQRILGRPRMDLVWDGEEREWHDPLWEAAELPK